jgi:hypothetical protein
VNELMDPQFVKLRQEELLREAETDRLARALRAARKRRTGRAPVLAWELKRIAGRLLKLLRGSKDTR